MKLKNIKLKFGGDLASPECLERASYLDIDGNVWDVPVHLKNDGRIYFPPPVGIDSTDLLKRIRKYFEIFNVNIDIDNSITHNLGNEPYFFILIVERYEPISDKFKNDLNDPKFDNFKRYIWGEYLDSDGSLPLGFVYGGSNMGIIFCDNSSGADWAAVIAHEIGHLFGLSHRGDITNTYTDTLNNNITIDENDNYYNDQPSKKHTQKWAPIMGALPLDSKLFQWSNGDYINAYPPKTSPESRLVSRASLIVRKGDDIKYISSRASLLKEPPTYFKENFNTQKPWDDFEDPFPKIDKKTARFITENFDSSLGYEGMIGYPYDYDILKILLPAGTYSFKMRSDLLDEENLLSSMLYPKLDLLYCNIELDKQKENISMDDTFGNINYDKAKYDTLDTAKIGITNQTKYVQTFGIFSDLYFSTKIENIKLDYTTMVYLRVCGNYYDPVDKDELPYVPYAGWSRYGSVGRYEISIEGEKKPLLKSYENAGWEIPNGHAEKFDMCDKKMFFFLQDEKDPQVSSDPFGLHVLEQSCVINGEVLNKKFLVYNQPVDMNAPEPEGKFFLTTLISGQAKKQEFIVGQGLVEDEESV